jgi:hypothetical protein
MAPGLPGRHGVAMRLTSDSRARTRPPDNELYDRGCDLVEAALAIRRLTGCDGAERALPAILACIESALKDLRGAVTEAGRLGGRDNGGDACGRRALRGFANLEVALADAETAAWAARGLAHRVADAGGDG